MKKPLCWNCYKKHEDAQIPVELEPGGKNGKCSHCLKYCPVYGYVVTKEDVR